ncbi:MAG: hypothetical protein M0P92_01415 [Acholeplasmataceae bacterium]|jgi:hypothetical protein|nr:hypothetical protein [Acholeplasmataceae bacterium]MCK9233586.1 hypothetical protein [Acholeplasmataceae bacterium]MCK9288770.1 hypothetical protein [Acholeplasmataceae bacterium]MCK9427324.1 hypothetical protein [Acholeplasmataceae bacterium]HHT39105.1 DUF5011 domain-containing protein [Acholeplasmataceae bacterium]
MKRWIFLISFLVFVPIKIAAQESIFSWPKTIIEVDVFSDINAYINALEKQIKLKEGYDDDRFFVETNGVEYTFVSTITTSHLKTYTHYFRAVSPKYNKKEMKAFYFHVVDNEAPTVISVKDFKMIIDGNKPNYEKGINVVDNYTPQADLSIEIDDSNVSYNEIGSYQIIFIVSDSSNNKVIKNAELTIIDPYPPTIKKTTIIDYQVKTNFTIEDYFSIEDNYDDYLMINYSFSNPLTVLGETVITVTAKDSSNNVSKATKTIRVIDEIAPELTLLNDHIYLEIYSEPIVFSELVKVSDNYDVLTFEDVVIKEEINYQELGEYQVTFEVLDSSLNKTTKTLTVFIIDSTPPIIEANDIITDEKENIDLLEGLETSDNYSQEDDLLISIYETNYQPQPGKYYVIYQIKDEEGNCSFFTRNITVTGSAEINSKITKELIVGASAMLAIGLIIMSIFLYKRRKHS